MTIIPCPAPSPLPYERSVGFASLRNSGRSTSGIHARPLSKGGGLTARHKLLSCCVLIATHLPFYSLNFYAVKTEGLLYAHQPLYPHNHCKSTSTASPRTMPLPPLSKGGGLTARHKLLSCCVLIATHLPFYSLNFYAVKTEGLLYTHRASQSPQPSQKHIHRLAPSLPTPHPSISHYSSSNIHFLPAYP